MRGNTRAHVGQTYGTYESLTVLTSTGLVTVRSVVAISDGLAYQDMAPALGVWSVAVTGKPQFALFCDSSFFIFHFPFFIESPLFQAVSSKGLYSPEGMFGATLSRARCCVSLSSHLCYPTVPIPTSVPPSKIENCAAPT